MNILTSVEVRWPLDHLVTRARAGVLQPGSVPSLPLITARNGSGKVRVQDAKEAKAGRRRDEAAERLTEL